MTSKLALKVSASPSWMCSSVTRGCDTGIMPLAESREPRHLLIFQDDGFRLASDFRGGDFDGNLPLDAVFTILRVVLCVRSIFPVCRFCGTHFYLSVHGRWSGWNRAFLRAKEPGRIHTTLTSV